MRAPPLPNGSAGSFVVSVGWGHAHVHAQRRHLRVPADGRLRGGFSAGQVIPSNVRWQDNVGHYRQAWVPQE